MTPVKRKNARFAEHEAWKDSNIKMNECNQGSLWKTSGGRIVLDNHNGEIFCLPYDKKLMTVKELTSGIRISEFLKRLGL